MGAALFSPVAALNDAPVCHGRRRGDAFDGHGFSRRIWHRLYFELGASRTSFDDAPGAERDETNFGLAARITSHALYRQPGSGNSTARPGQWTDLAARWLTDGRSISGAFVHADSLVLGRYWRAYGDSIGSSGEPDGHGLLLGMGSSFDYDGRSLPSVWDRTLAVGLLGPMVEVAARRGRLAMRATVAASYGFAQVTSLAYVVAAPEFANVIIKTELKNLGYYYAQGLLTFTELEAELADVRLTLDGRTQSFWSIDFRDDQQAMLQNNFSLSDTRIFLSAMLSWQPLGGPIRLASVFEDVIRDSSLLGYVVHSNERRVVGLLSLVF